MADGGSQSDDNATAITETPIQGDLRSVEVQGVPLESDGSRQPLYLPLIDEHIMRLVELEPGDPDAEIRLRIFVVELEFAPAYEAVSYVWGDTQDTRRILCNGRPTDVTANLYSALVRLRYTDKPRILWADAVCINQGHLRERSHQVAFMNIIYRHAARVMLCFGKDSGGGADDVTTLLQEHNLRRAGYESVSQMPILAPHDPLFDDPRWRSLATLMKQPWFTRAWVLQEAGVAKDPRVLYGDAEFSYRDLMMLVRWIVRCASNLGPRAGVDSFTIHVDWEDWSPDWRAKAADPSYTLLDFLSHARGLSCKDSRDHVYAFLGHPLAQLEDGTGPIILPDYTKDVREVYLDLTAWLIQRHGFRVLSMVEHDESSIVEDFPSWVFRWDNEIVKNSFGVYPGFYYRASADVNPDVPITSEGRVVIVSGIVVDKVSKSYKFSTTKGDLESPEQLKSTNADYHPSVTLDQIWTDVQLAETPCIYPNNERMDAFSLALCGGLANYERAEDDLERHRADFAAYWKLWLQSKPAEVIPAELAQTGDHGDEERFWTDMDLCTEGRSFVITEKGYYGLGPWITKPGDICCVLLGCNVPFILRETGTISHYKLVGEAYLHGLMGGEFLKTQEGKIKTGDTILIC